MLGVTLAFANRTGVRTSGRPCVVDIERASVTASGECPGEITLAMVWDRFGPPRLETRSATTGGEGACSVTYRNRLLDQLGIVEWVHSAAPLEPVATDCPDGIEIRFHSDPSRFVEGTPSVLVDVTGTAAGDFGPTGATAEVPACPRTAYCVDLPTWLRILDRPLNRGRSLVPRA